MKVHVLKFEKKSVIREDRWIECRIPFSSLSAAKAYEELLYSLLGSKKRFRNVRIEEEIQ